MASESMIISARAKEMHTAMEISADECSAEFERADETMQHRFSTLGELLEQHLSKALACLQTEISKSHKIESHHENAMGILKRAVHYLDRSPPHRSHPHRQLQLLRLPLTHSVRVVNKIRPLICRLPTELSDSTMRDGADLRNFITSNRFPLPSVEGCFFTGGDYFDEDPSRNYSFKKPYGIAIHPATSEVFVCDSEHACIRVLGPDLKYIRTISPMEGQDFKFLNPTGICFNLRGDEIVVASEGDKTIHVIDLHGNLVRTLLDGSTESPISCPIFVASDLDGYIYISCRIHNLIVKYDHYYSIVGCFHLQQEKSSKIMGITVTDDNIVLVATAGNFIYPFTTDGEQLPKIPVKEYGSDNYLDRAADGAFILSDWDHNTITFYTITGEVLNQRDYERPVGVAFGPNGRLYVCNWRRSSVESFCLTESNESETNK